MTRDRIVAIFLILVGAVGVFAAAELTIERVLLAADANATLNCNFSLIVQCGKNLASWQGALFGFPNAIIGTVGFMAPIVVGASILAGATFARWYWIVFNLGMLGAVTLVAWLIHESIFDLGTLCPWCMLVWSVTIPGFLVTTFRNAAAGVFGRHLVRIGGILLSWVVPITIAVYLTIAIIAQLRLDVLGHL